MTIRNLKTTEATKRLLRTSPTRCATTAQHRKYVDLLKGHTVKLTSAQQHYDRHTFSNSVCRVPKHITFVIDRIGQGLWHAFQYTSRGQWRAVYEADTKAELVSLMRSRKRSVGGR